MSAARSARSSWRRRFVQFLPKVFVIGLVANAVRLRLRLKRLGTLPVRDAGSPSQLDGWVFVTAAGVHLDDETRCAAVTYAERCELDVVDLVPADLPVDRALETLRMVATDSYRHNRLHPGRGAYQAIAVSADVAARAQLEEVDGLDPFEMVQVTTKLKRYAPATTDLAVAPGLQASPDDLEKRQSFLRAIYGGAVFAPPMVQGVQLAGLVAALRANPVWGAAAAVTYSAQPLAVFAGAPAGLEPRDLTRHSARRILDDVVGAARTWTSRWRSPKEIDEHEIRRAVYDELLADGIDHFFEPRRDECPWCGSTNLSVRLTAPDHLQHKPGLFTLEECADCAVVFQNPRLSIEGLDFYYRDFYDGLGEEQLEFIFGASDRPYTGRADMLKPYATPKRWLDVGTGHAHFCLVAKEAWPDTVFDGLDMSESIEEAERRGWIDHGYRGLFPELAPELAATYDVVSMHHYLEHVREPYDELDAAVTALGPGGHLLIEVPDPESVWGSALNSLWLPWFQPQHQTLIPIANLRKALEDRGFTIVAEDRGEADQPVDLLAAAWFLIDGLAPNPRLPWGPPPTLARRATRVVALTIGVPVLALAGLADVIQGAVLRNTTAGNGYRLLAQKSA